MALSLVARGPALHLRGEPGEGLDVVHGVVSFKLLRLAETSRPSRKWGGHETQRGGSHYHRDPAGQQRAQQDPDTVRARDWTLHAH